MAVHRWRWRLAVLVLILSLPLLGCPPGLHAQDLQGRCRQVRINQQGTSGASITVNDTTGGILVAEANTSRCWLWITNETSNGMRCASATGQYALTVTSSVGMTWPANPVPLLGEAAQQAWKCIRTGSSSATVSVMEGLP